MAKSFMHERPKALVDIATNEFKDLLKKTTGLQGEMFSKFTAGEIAEKLQAKQLDFGVFYGHEFAWAQKKCPDLIPLLIAAHKNHQPCAFLLVNKNGPITSVNDLKGKKLGMPMGTSEPTRLFLAKACGEEDPQRLDACFTVSKFPSATDALNDLARQKVDGVLVDSRELEFYKEVKGPVFERNLKVLQQSDPFPSVVIVYKKGGVTAEACKQFCDGLRAANTIPIGREMMKSWHIDSFEPVPADYAKSIANVLKTYPAPGVRN
jgi:ABC-type phosphate/phosphonate transport system substrate-binding protein